MSDVAVVVYGATGFTGRLVCAELARRKVRFAVAGRDRDKLTALAATLPTAQPEVLVAALDDRRGARGGDRARARGARLRRAVRAHGRAGARSGARRRAPLSRHHRRGRIHAGDGGARRRSARARRGAGQRRRLRRGADGRGGGAGVGGGGRQARALAHRHPRSAGARRRGRRARRSTHADKGGLAYIDGKYVPEPVGDRSLAGGLSAADRRSRVRVDPVGRSGDGAALDGRAHDPHVHAPCRRRWRG